MSRLAEKSEPLCEECRDTGRVESNIDGADVETYCDECELGRAAYEKACDHFRPRKVPRCNAQAWNNGPGCDRDLDHEGEHCATREGRRNTWTTTEPLVACGICKGRVERSSLNGTLCKSCFAGVWSCND